MGDGRAADIASGSSNPGHGQAVVWGAALVFAFFPVLADLVQHMGERPWARYAAIFPLLALLGAFRERDARPGPRSDAPLWILAGLAVLLAGMLMGAIRWGRIGAALAAIGWCRRFGLAGWRTQVLLCFAVPVPAALMRMAEPLAHRLGEAAGALGAPLGVDVLPVLSRFGSGLPLAALLAGLSWYTSLLCLRPLPAALARAAGAALLGFPLQLLANLAAGAALPWLGVTAARAALAQLPALAVTLAGVAGAERAARRGAR